MKINLQWPLDEAMTGMKLSLLMFNKEEKVFSGKRMPDYAYILKELLRNGGFKDKQTNETYQEMAEHYGTAILPARVWASKNKPNAEGTINCAIRDKPDLLHCKMANKFFTVFAVAYFFSDQFAFFDFIQIFLQQIY